MNEPSKLCYQCDTVKLLTEFGRQSATRDGLKTECKVCISKRMEKRYEENQNRLLNQVKQWQRDNPDQRRKQQNSTSQKPQHKIYKKLREAINEMINGEKKTSLRFGYTSQQLRNYIESLFDSEMNWQNYKTYWTVDHIEPLCSFNALDEKELVRANQLSNLQPLTLSDNSKKLKQDLKKRYIYSEEEKTQLQQRAEENRLKWKKNQKKSTPVGGTFSF